MRSISNSENAKLCFFSYTKTTCNLKTKYPSAESGTFRCPYEEYYSRDCAYYLFFLLWENAGFAVPFGITQVIHDL